MKKTDLIIVVYILTCAVAGIIAFLIAYTHH